MSDKQFSPASLNEKAPAPGMAAVNTDNEEESQVQDKKQAALTDKRIEYDERAHEQEKNKDDV